MLTIYPNIPPVMIITAFQEGNNQYPVMDFYMIIPLTKPPLKKKIDMARQVEQIAKNYDSRISVIERSSYEDTEFSSLIMNTNGLYAYAKGKLRGNLYIFSCRRKWGCSKWLFHDD